MFEKFQNFCQVPDSTGELQGNGSQGTNVMKRIIGMRNPKKLPKIWTQAPPPLPTLKMLKNYFLQKNPEMVETFPNVMERIVGVSNPKKSQKSKNTPPVPPLYMLKSKNFEIIKNYHKCCETFTNVMKRIIGMRNPKKLPKI